MDRITFWKIVEEGRSVGDGVYHAAAPVTAILNDYSSNDIVSFVQHQYDLLDESYRWDLWAIAYILNGGCSDDGFEYFRAWLMANGQERWNAAMKQPESVGEWIDWNEISYEYEDFLRAGILAYEVQTKEEFPYNTLRYNRYPEPIGTPWNEDQLDNLYPALSKKRYESWPEPPALPDNKQT